MSNTAHSTDTITATQLAAVAASSARLDRARAHAQRLDAHAADIRTRLDAAAGAGTAGPLRGELVEVERQRRQAADALTAVEGEHARHAADLAALFGADGEARAALRDRQAERDAASAEADEASALLSRAKAHREAVEGRLAAARVDEDRHDDEASARLHAALRDGTEAPSTAEPLVRASGWLDDDLRAASAAEARAASGHRARLSALAEAEGKVRGAADAVLLAEADAMAREIVALDARADLLRSRLKAYAARVPGDHVAPPEPARRLNAGGWWESTGVVAPAPRVHQSPAIAAALVDRAYVTERPRDTSAEAHAWAAFAGALASDAEAEAGFMTTPPGPAPLPVMNLARYPASSEPGPAVPAAA